MWCLFNTTKTLGGKRGDPFSNQNNLEFLRVTFLSSCADEQAKAAEVMVPSYFWRGYQRPCDIGLSDRTSVALNTPLTLLGQAFLSVSRHTHSPPSHYTTPSSSLSLSFHVMVDRGGRTRVCMCVPERRPWRWTQRDVSSWTVWQARSTAELCEGGPDCQPWGQCTKGPVGWKHTKTKD